MLKGDRVLLREFRRSDLAELRKWVNDEETNRYLGFWTFPQTEEQTLEYLERQLGREAPFTDIELVITLKDDPEGTYIGGVGLHGIDWRNRNAELGIVIGRKELQGQGLGTEAIRLMLGYAFDFLNLHKVNLVYFEYNARGRRCYEKCGFKEEGRVRENRYWDGRYWDVIRMGITAEEYHK
ncbi:MAG: GNAT family N-acetyltransferase [Chitinophagales bacterium]